MPHRLDQHRAKVQFVTSAEMPSLIARAVVAGHAPSNTVYIQHAVVAALARDLGLDEAALRAKLPPPVGPSASLFGRDRKPVARQAHGRPLNPEQDSEVR